MTDDEFLSKFATLVVWAGARAGAAAPQYVPPYDAAFERRCRVQERQLRWLPVASRAQLRTEFTDGLLAIYRSAPPEDQAALRPLLEEYVAPDLLTDPPPPES